MAEPSVKDALDSKRDEYVIGSGKDREVYRKPESRWVYKFDDCAGYVNRREFQNYTYLKNVPMPKDVKIPEMRMLSDEIIAVEYVEGYMPDNYCDRFFGTSCDRNHFCWEAKVMPWCYENALADICKVNVIVNEQEGTVYIIDLGE